MSTAELTTAKIKAFAKLLSRLLTMLVIGYGLQILSDIVHSNVAGEGEMVLYKNEKGITTVGKISGSAKKSPPKQQKKLTMASLGFGLDQSKHVEVKRKTFSIFGFDAYLGGGATVTKEGTFIPVIGITILF